MGEIIKSIGFKLSGALVIATACLAWYAVDTTKKLQKAKKMSETLETTISDLNQKMHVFEIRMNDSTTIHAATVKNLRMTASNIQAKYNELLAASKIKKKDVNQVATIGTETIDTVYVPVAVDNFGGLKTGYKDQFIDISVCIDPERLATIAYSARDSLSLIVTQKKHSILFGLIKWKSLEKTTVINHNPKATISSLETINVIE